MPLAAIDHHEVRERSPGLEEAAVAPQDDLLHGREIVGPGLRGARGRSPAGGFRRPRGFRRCRPGRVAATATAPRPTRAAAPAFPAADPELPVLRPLHPTVLADHHRRHGLAPLDRGDVEALDAPRRRRQPERLLERGEGRLLRPSVRAEARLVGEGRVAAGQVEQRPLVAAPGDGEAHAPAGARGEPVLDGVALGDLHREVDLRGHVAVPVELLHGGLHHVRLAVRRRLRAVGDQLHPLDDAPAPHLEDLDDGPGRSHPHAEGVAVAELGRRHLLLPVAERLHRPHGVPVVRRLLVALLVGRGAHAAVEAVEHLLRLPLEEQARVPDRLRVLRLAADLGDARRDAALDVVLQAGAAALPRDDLVARTDAEQAVREGHRPPGERGREERAGVVVAVAGHLPRHEHAGEALGRRELQVRVVLVVPQEDVEPRRALLDQVVLEGEGLDERVRDDDLQAGDLVEQGVGLGARAVRPEVAPDAIPERPRPAHVDRLPAAVVVQVHSRLLRQPADLLPEITNGHPL